LDEAEMSQILKEAFRLYGYEVAQAFNVPTALKPLVNGDAANVTVKLTRNNTLTLTEYVVDEETKKKLKACRKTVKEQAEEIDSLKREATQTVKKIVEPEDDEYEPDSDAMVPLIEPKVRYRR